VLRANLKWKLVSQLVGSCLAVMLMIGLTSCDRSTATIANLSVPTDRNSALVTTDGALSEVNIPDSISRLAPRLEKFQPQVQILSPKLDEILSDDRVTVKLKVTDLPLFKHPELGLGNHLHVILDKQTYQGVYDLQQPLVFKNLAAGTHTLRVFASRPWHESFKNEGAYAQVTFHILTKTAENNPDRQQPLLTYSRPTGTYGAEPIMLDYYLTNAPSHLVAKGSQDSLPDWRIRVTVNDQRFILDRWAPVYLKGFKQGKNWVRLELIDDHGNPIPNAYNDTVAIVTYDPQTTDTLAKLIRGELNPNLALTLIDPDYIAVETAPPPTPTPTRSVAPSIPVNTPTPIPAPIVTTPIAIDPPTIESHPSPSPAITPQPIAKILPIPSPEPVQAAAPIVQPSISPSPISPPIVINPPPAPAIERPASISNPTPVEMPSPEVAKSSPNPSPQPTVTFKPILTPTPSPPAVVTPPVTTFATPVEPSPLPRQQPAPAATPVAPPQQIQHQAEQTWQSQAIELLKVAQAKTRAFTNTIPAKAQRFGQNVRVWTGKAMDLVQEWRNRE
jgi:hypothetical protein